MESVVFWCFWIAVQVVCSFFVVFLCFLFQDVSSLPGVLCYLLVEEKRAQAFEVASRAPAAASARASPPPWRRSPDVFGLWGVIVFWMGMLDL